MSDDAFTQTRRILRVLLDKHKAPPMALVALANLRRIEDHHRFLSQRIATLEAQREAVADVASEGDVEDLLDALDNLSADPKDGETWGARYQTAGAMHAACQEERIRRTLAEEDAERWHRLFDEGATLTAQIAAERDRLAAEVERLTAEVARETIAAQDMSEQMATARADRDRYRDCWKDALAGLKTVGAERDALRTKLADVEKDRQRLDADVRAAHNQAAELEMVKAQLDRLTAEPLATVTTAVHPDEGDGPWVEVGRVAVPRAKGPRVAVTIREEES